LAPTAATTPTGSRPAPGDEPRDAGDQQGLQAASGRRHPTRQAVDGDYQQREEDAEVEHQFFGLWLAGSLSQSPNPPGAPESHAEASQPQRTPWGDTEQDLADAEALWRRYSPAARAMFSLLMDHPDQEYTGEQIAQEVNIPNGAHGVAGVHAWPGRYGNAIGRGLPSEWREDPETLQSFYWMPAATAQLFRAARARVEPVD
jgi:Family of unknown function (DUF6416)